MHNLENITIKVSLFRMLLHNTRFNFNKSVLCLISNIIAIITKCHHNNNIININNNNNNNNERA